MESLKTRVHAAVDTMLEGLLASFTEAEPTLEGLERALLNELHRLGDVTLAALCSALALRYAATQSAAAGSRTPQRSRLLSYVSELGARPLFAQSLWLEADRGGLEQARTVVFVGDGAQWYHRHTHT